MQKRWSIKPKADASVVMQLASDLSIDDTIANILVQRGINSFDKAKKFFRPSLTDLHNPFLMKDMDKAIVRLTKAINSNEKILIYGDYDVDGTTSVACMFRFLQKIYSRELTDFYIPHRYREGYG